MDARRRRELVELAGSFWSDVFGQKELAADILAARGRLEDQTLRLTDEAVACLNRHETPKHRTVLWYPLVLRRSQREDGLRIFHRYGGTLAYGGNAAYGVPSSSPLEAVFPLPNGLLGASLILDRFYESSVVYTEGIDCAFDVSEGLIRFRPDPFAIPEIPQQPVYVEGQQEDEEIVLWLFMSRWSAPYLWEHVYYPLQLRLPNTSAGKDYANGLWDVTVGGPTRGNFTALLAAWMDVAVAKEDEETVELVEDRADAETIVVTDKHAYSYDRVSSPRVVVGDVVFRGDPLTDDIVVFSFHQGQAPSPIDLSALHVGPEFLGPGYEEGLTFLNADVPVTPFRDATGALKVRFEIGGPAKDVERFWQDVDAREETLGKSLAEVLDVRTDPQDPPSESNLPATINPLAFLAKTVLRGHALVMKVRLAPHRPDALPYSVLQATRRILPPWDRILLGCELAGESSYDTPIRNTSDGQPDLGIAGTANYSVPDYTFSDGRPWQ